MSRVGTGDHETFFTTLAESAMADRSVGSTGEPLAALTRLGSYGARLGGRASGWVAARVPTFAIVFWSLVVGVDFLNDWLIVGLTQGFRPVRGPLLDMVVWWTPWIAATPLIVGLARRMAPDRVGWRRSLAVHLPVMTAAVYAHALFAAWLFARLGGGRVWHSFEHFARQFTLSECLLYWALIATTYVGRTASGGSGPAAGSEPLGRVSAQPASTVVVDRDPARSHIRRFAVRHDDVTRFVTVTDVDYIEAAGNYVRLHVGSDDHLIRATLAGVQERLDPDRFRRIHRSTIVNLDRVAEVTAWFNGDCVATLRDGRRLRVSRTYRDGLVEPLG